MILQNISFDGLQIDRSRGGADGPYDQLDGNSDGISYFKIYVNKINKYQTKYKLTDITLSLDEKSANMSCSAGSLPYFDCDNRNNKEYTLDLYKYVDSFEKINLSIVEGHTNLRLSKDIDEKITASDEFALVRFAGTIDGNGHTIKEIETNNCFIKTLAKGGTIKNLNIDKYTVNYSPSGSYGNYAGLVCIAETGSEIDNVHIGGGGYYDPSNPTYVTIAHHPTNTIYVGGLVGKATGLSISNSSISQITFKDINAKDADNNRLITEPERNIINGSVYIGGLVAVMDNTDITNSFVRNINFKVNSYIEADPGKDNAVFGYENIHAIGGIAGKVNSGTIENVYATGAIDAKRGNGLGYMGGIVGHNLGTLKSVVSKVNVFSNDQNIGGVIGYTTEGSSKAMQTLALGDLLTALQSYETLDRTSGTRISNNKNFAWNKQSINSKIDANTNLEELLSEEDLRNTSVYQTKLGFNADDFALNFNELTPNDDYYMVVLDENDNRYIVKQDSIKVVETEDGSLNEVAPVKRGEETVEIVVAKKAGTIPRLRHTETGEILNNQDYEVDYRDVKIEYMEKFELSSDPTYKYCVWDTVSNKAKCGLEPWDAEFVQLEFDLEVKDPAIDLSSLGFTISDMHLFNPDKAATVINNGIGQPVTVNVDVVADDNKNYDSFNIEQIKYNLAPDQNGFVDPTDYTYPTKIKMVIPFYGRIDDLDTWQGIKKGTYQNYSLAADLDFSKLPEGDVPNAELSFNKLIGLHPKKEEIDNGLVVDKKNYSIYNYETTAPCIVKGVSSELRTINFGAIIPDKPNEGYIKINSSSTSKVGVIQSLTGKLYGYNETASLSYNVGFYNVSINASSGNQVGMVAYNNSSNITEINLENIYVNGLTNVGGFIGYSELKDKYNITAKNVTVIGNGNYVGGVIGYDKVSSSRIYINNVTVEGVDITNTSGSYTGGAFGKGVANNVTVIGTTDKYHIKGKSYTGGIYGDSSGHSNFNYSTAENLNIRGEGSYVGGVAGQSGGNNYAISRNNTIVGTSWHIGGVMGLSYNGRKYQYSIGNSISGSVSVGGIIGYNGSTLEYAQVGPYRDADGNVRHTTVTGSNYYVGGIAGYTSTAAINYTINQASIQGQHTVGGVIGMIQNTGTGTNATNVSMNHNIVANSIIKATGTISTTIPVHGEGTNTDSNSVSTWNTTNKSFFYLGGLIGRFYRNLTASSNIKSNIISADIIAGSLDKNINEYNGVGYVFGGSSYYYKNLSYVKDYYVDEEGVTRSKNVPYYSIYDWSTSYGDTYINKSVNGKLESYTSSIRLTNDSTFNRMAFGDLPDTDGALFQHYGTIYGGLSGALIGTSDTKIKNMDCYNATYYNMSGSDSTPTALQYYPYPKAGYNEVTNIAINEWPAARAEKKEPTAAAAASTTSVMSSSSYHLLPDFEVYASDVDKINIEFREIDPLTYFAVNGKSYYVNKTTYTFYYDFKEDFEIVVSDNINSKTIKVTADDIKNGVQVIGDYYYKLEDGDVISNQPKIIVEDEIEEDVVEEIPVEEEVIGDIVEQQKEKSEEQTEEDEQVAYATSPSVALLSAKKELSNPKQYVLDGNDSNKLVDNATNIYGEEILLDNQNIYDITTGEIKENSFENLTLAETTPLHTFEYNDQKIETYLNYSIVDGQRVSKQIYVKNGQIEVIEQGINNDKSQLFIQNYNDKSFVIYLGKDGKIYSLKDSVSYPKNFKNINIKSISSSLSKDTDNLLVEYEDGSYVAFNYRTGQIISEYKDKNISLIDYVKDYLEISTDKAKATSTNNSYEEAKKLVSKLNKKSINQVLKGEDDGTSAPELYSRKYSIVYNPTTDKYDVYEIPTKSQTSEKSLTKALSTTVDSIIDSNPVLVKYYRNNESSKINKVSALMITIGIVVGIVCATILVGGYYKKVRKQRT